MDRELEDLTRADFSYVYDNTNLDWDDRTKKAMLPQSTRGRIIEGHGPYFHEYFKEHKKLNDISYEEILSILKIDEKENLDYRTQLAIEVRDWVFNLITKPSDPIRFVNKEGKPLSRSKSLGELVFPLEKRNIILKGLIASFMDSDYYRKRTVAKYGTTLNDEKMIMGYGQEEPFDLEILESSNQTPRKLETEEHTEQQIKLLRTQGLIKKLNGSDWSLTDGNIKNLYVRGKKGDGGCDDASLSSIGLIHGAEAYLLGILFDFLDTVGKYCNLNANGGIDESLGISASKLLKEGFISPEEIMQIIYLGAKRNFPNIEFSSSARRLMEIAPNSTEPTFMEHYKWIKNGTRPPSHKLGFEGLLNQKFYDRLAQRFVLSGLKKYVPKHQEKEKPKKVQSNNLSKRSIPKRLKNTFNSLKQILQEQGISESEIQRVYLNVPLFNNGKYSTRLDLENMCGKEGIMGNREVQICKVPSNRRTKKRINEKGHKFLNRNINSSLDLVIFSEKGAIIIEKGKHTRTNIKKKFEQNYGKNVRSVIYV